MKPKARVLVAHAPQPGENNEQLAEFLSGNRVEARVVGSMEEGMEVLDERPALIMPTVQTMLRFARGSPLSMRRLTSGLSQPRPFDLALVFDVIPARKGGEIDGGNPYFPASSLGHRAQTLGIQTFIWQQSVYTDAVARQFRGLRVLDAPAFAALEAVS